MSRVLCTKASGTPPRRLPHCSATLMRPASGETTTVLPGIDLRLDVLDQRGHGPQVIHRAIEEALCLGSMQVNAHDAIRASGAEQTVRRAEMGSRPMCFLSSARVAGSTA